MRTAAWGRLKSETKEECERRCSKGVLDGVPRLGWNAFVIGQFVEYTENIFILVKLEHSGTDQLEQCQTHQLQSVSNR